MSRTTINVAEVRRLNAEGYSRKESAEQMGIPVAQINKAWKFLGLKQQNVVIFEDSSMNDKASNHVMEAETTGY